MRYFDEVTLGFITKMSISGCGNTVADAGEGLSVISMHDKMEVINSRRFETEAISSDNYIQRV